MPSRLKKLIGTILLVALVIVYALAASIVAVGLASRGRWCILLLPGDRPAGCCRRWASSNG